jgi:hypothetical protein
MTTSEQRLDTLHQRNLTDTEIEEVVDILHAEPDLWRRYGDTNDWTRGQILQIVNDNDVDFTCTVEGIKQMRKELLEDGDSILEVIAVEQIITNHLQVARSGHELEKIIPCQELSAVARHWTKVHNMASSRLFRAINHLMRIRRNIMNTVVKIHQHRNIDFRLSMKKFNASLKSVDNWAKLGEKLDRMQPQKGDDFEISVPPIPTSIPESGGRIDHEQFLEELVQDRKTFQAVNAELANHSYRKKHAKAGK